jgi:hypothetical protein
MRRRKGTKAHIVATNDAVNELHGAVQCNVEEEDIEKQCSRRGILNVAIPDMDGNLLR